MCIGGIGPDFERFVGFYAGRSKGFGRRSGLFQIRSWRFREEPRCYPLSARTLPSGDATTTGRERSENVEKEAGRSGTRCSRREAAELLPAPPVRLLAEALQHGVPIHGACRRAVLLHALPGRQAAGVATIGARIASGIVAVPHLY